MSDSLPPQRRRDTDHVSWRRVGLGSALGAAVAVLPLVQIGLRVHERWVAHEAAANRVLALEAKIREIEQRVERLERWQCVLGWNPPISRGQRECSRT